MDRKSIGTTLVVDTSYWELELEALTHEAERLAKEYYTWCKQQNRFITLWVRVKRKDQTLSIEWVVPKVVKDGKNVVLYLRKGKRFSYNHATLIKHFKEQHLPTQEQITYITELESRFADIRKAADLLKKAKSSWRQYEEIRNKIINN